MLSVFINGRFGAQPVTGLQRYASEVTKRLLAPNHIRGSGSLNISLMTPDVSLSGCGSKTFWEQVILPSQSSQGILFSPCNAGPWFHPKHLVTVHDVRASDPKWNRSIPFITRLYSQISLGLLSRTAKRFLTVSHYSKSRMIERYKIAAEQITVAYPGADHILDTPPDVDILSALSLNPQEYVLAVNSLLPHKNTAILKSINWARYGVRLCIVGTVPQARSQSFPRSTDGSIIYAGRVSDAAIRALYSNALAYVFPSLYEGFGIPPLEAMYCGCPVIASDQASIPEICGDGSLYFDPHSTTALDSSIRAIICEPRLRDQMIRKGYERAHSFRWDACAEIIATLLFEMAVYPPPAYGRG